MSWSIENGVIEETLDSFEITKILFNEKPINPDVAGEYIDYVKPSKHAAYRIVELSSKRLVIESVKSGNILSCERIEFIL